LGVAGSTSGKVYAAGEFYDFTGPRGFSVVRYHSNGVLDSSFGIAGITKYDPVDYAKSGPDGQPAIFREGMLQPDDKYLFMLDGWSAYEQAAKQMTVVRMTQDGLLDPTFGVNGQNRLSLPSRYSTAHAMDVAADGSIFISVRDYLYTTVYN